MEAPSRPAQLIGCAPSAESQQDGSASRPPGSASSDRLGLLLTVEQVALLWFGEVGEGGSSSSNCQKIRRLIPETLPARRIGNRWFVHRDAAESWAAGSDPASVMAHPDTRRWSA